VQSLTHVQSELLKQPLETAVSIHIDDFENFHAEEDMHVVISVKDFKAIVTHAETLRTPVIAAFSRPSRPLQFSYQTLGMHCEFILMTSGDYRGTATSSTPKSVTTRPSTRQSSALSTQAPAPTTINTDMPPPPKPMSTLSQIQRKPLSALNRGISLTAPSQDSDSLFVPNDVDGDRRWEEPDYDNEEAEDMLGWDANGELNSAYHPTLRDAGSHAPNQQTQQSDDSISQGLQPTQRLSQIHGLFD